MAGVTFSHPNPDIGTLNIRLPPSSVEWTYNMNVQTWDTYAGQVVQILSLNFDKLIVTGRLGKEGPHGNTKNLSQFRDFKRTSPFGIGLTQINEYFQAYFSIASQGNDALYTGNFDQRGLKLTYDGALDVPIDTGKTETWLVYPVGFPSFRRSIQDFAPEWRVECEVIEPAIDIKTAAEQDEIKRLRDAVGYTPSNKFSDPYGYNLPTDNLSDRTPAQNEALLKAAKERASGQLDDTFSHFQGMLPAYTTQDLEHLLLMDGSLPLARIDAGTK